MKSAMLFPTRLAVSGWVGAKVFESAIVHGTFALLKPHAKLVTLTPQIDVSHPRNSLTFATFLALLAIAFGELTITFAIRSHSMRTNPGITFASNRDSFQLPGAGLKQ